jgi:hypothetical protein
MTQNITLKVMCPSCHYSETAEFSKPHTEPFDIRQYLDGWSCRICKKTGGNALSYNVETELPDEEIEIVVDKEDESDSDVDLADDGFEAYKAAIEQILSELLYTRVEEDLEQMETKPSHEITDEEWGILPCFSIQTREDGENCGVCLNSAVGEKIMRLPCKHEFHRACIIPWLRRNNSCPLCKAVVVTN